MASWASGWRVMVLRGRPPVAALGSVLALAGAPVLAQPASAPPEIHHIHGLAFAPGDADVLYVATHTGLVRLAPGAAPRSVGEHRFDLMGFTADPRDPTLVYASGHPDVPTYARERVGNLGLLLSRDGGRTWQSVALRGQADFHALTLSLPAGLLYGWSVAGQRGLHRISLGTWKAERVDAQGLDEVLALAASPAADGPLLAGTTTGLRISRDGGATWSPLKAVAGGPVPAVAFHPANARRLYAYLHRADAGLLHSRDGGARWERTAFGARREAAVIALAVGPGEQVAVATSDGDMARSSDGGQTWTALLRRGRPAAAR